MKSRHPKLDSGERREVTGYIDVALKYQSVPMTAMIYGAIKQRQKVGIGILKRTPVKMDVQRSILGKG